MKTVNVKGRKGGHCQGIAIDKDRKYMYFSFTTELVKTDMEGNVVGSCKGLVGHLGCIAMNYEENKIYGSLEFKHDSIGKGILSMLGIEDTVEDGFYIAIFDCDKIVRENMDAEKDGVMKASFLKEVYDDYKYEGHKYGCSGIDGTTIAPDIGLKDGKKSLYVAYGIYSDINRTDNDNQVILKYDLAELNEKSSPLNQKNMHRIGPKKPSNKYFLYTGNTNWGVQNLEYDPYRNVIMAAVYRGKKEKYKNFNMFFIDMSKAPVFDEIEGLNEKGNKIYLKEAFEKDEANGTYGSFFPYGSTGMISLGDGFYVFSEDFHNEYEGHGTNAVLYKAEKNNQGFIKVS
ncbi:MAG: hypothetical protein E7564_09930 [Ruminococcaceae bacterium]|nr:hypothetical protein [Oscillospiraceae bacterium]